MLSLPRTASQMVESAAEVAKSALQEGVSRQLLTFINPVNEKSIAFLASNAIDYPCSTMAEFESIVLLTQQFMAGVLGPATELQVERIDEGGIDGDLCCLVYPKDRRSVAVVWPTAERLKVIKKLAEDPRTKSLFIVNALWKTEGLLVSEFGVGPWRAANEAFVATFAPTYVHYELRIGAPSSVDVKTGTRYASGAVVRVLRQQGGNYQVFVLAADGASQAIGSFPERPKYAELDALVDRARRAKMQIFDLAVAASSLSLENAGPAVPAQEGEEKEFYTPEEVKALDPKAMRRVLMQLGLPSAGTPMRLQQRVLALADRVAEGDSLERAVAVVRKMR